MFAAMNIDMQPRRRLAAVGDAGASSLGIDECGSC